jgi:hypothetical protein
MGAAGRADTQPPLTRGLVVVCQTRVALPNKTLIPGWLHAMWIRPSLGTAPPGGSSAPRISSLGLGLDLGVKVLNLQGSSMGSPFDLRLLFVLMDNARA